MMALLALSAALLLAIPAVSQADVNITGNWVFPQDNTNCPPGHPSGFSPCHDTSVGYYVHDMTIVDNNGTLTGSANGGDLTLSGNATGNAVNFTMFDPHGFGNYSFNGTVDANGQTMGGTCQPFGCASLQPSGAGGGTYTSAWDATRAATKISLTLTPDTVNVCGDTCASDNNVNATVSVTGADGKKLSGQSVALSADDPGVAVSAVTDAGAGTYTATLRPSHTPGAVIVTATDNSPTPAASGSATLTQECDPNAGTARDASAGGSADLRSGVGPIALAADAKHCTRTTLRCLGSVDPFPATCVVTVQDMTQKPTQPTPPTGNLVIMVSQIGHSSSSFKTPDCTLIPSPGGMSRSNCTVNFEPTFDTLVNPHDPYFNYGPVPILQPAQGIKTVRSFRIKAFYNPGDATHSISGGVAQFTIRPANQQNYWSTPGGKNILKYWAVAEGGGYLATKATLDSAKGAEAVAKLSGVEVTGATKFIVGKANVYFVAVSTGLQIAGWADASYAAFVDPFDSHYKVVAKPKPMRAPTVTVANAHDRRMLNSFLNNVERQHAVTTVLGTTENRAASAHKVGDKHAYKLQERAISRYLRELAGLTDAQLASQMAIERVLKKMLRAAHLGLIISLPRIPHAWYAAEVASDPQTLEQARLLRSVGAPNSYVADMEAAEEHARIPAKFDLLNDIVNLTMIRDERKVSAMLRAEARKVPFG